MNTYAVIDFETTGLSPNLGARPTEIAVALVTGNRIVDRFQSLMNPEVSIPHNIQLITGITNDMVRSAPSIPDVMKKVTKFVGSNPIVAHNAAFDRQFWESETRSLRIKSQHEFICSLILARLIYPKSPNHKLETLVRTLDLPSASVYHRALADAECTALLLIRIQQEIIVRYKVPTIDSRFLMAIQSVNKSNLDSFIRNYSEHR